MEGQCGCVLHNLSKAHGLIYTRNGYCQILDNRRDRSTLFGTWGMELRPYPKKPRNSRTFIDHLLERGCRVDLHCKQVIEAIDFGGVFTELLAKGV